jgi:hypothetical protein
VLPGQLREGDMILQERLEHPEALHSPSTLGLRNATEAS